MSKLYLFFLALLISGCGYTLRGSGSVLPPDIKKVYIAPVENNSTESGLGRIMTVALQDEFDRYGQITVVDSLADADAILTARIVKLSRSNRSVTSGSDLDLQKDTSMTIAADLKRVSGGTLWQAKDFVVSQTFGSTSNSVVTSSPEFSLGSIAASDLNNLDSREVSRGQERQALNDLSIQVAEKIYESAVLPDF